MRKTTLLVGFTAGYVLGAQAGRERYDQIAGLAGKVRQRPEVQNAASVVQDKASTLETKAVSAVNDKVENLTGSAATS